MDARHSDRGCWAARGRAAREEPAAVLGGLPTVFVDEVIPSHQSKSKGG
jgi:hypothetical protein